MNLPHLYSVEREFNFPIDALWQAWTDASALESWYHPVGMSCVPGTSRSEAKVGGLWTYAVQAPGRDSISYFYGKYSQVEKNIRFEHSMHYTESSADFELMDFNTPAHSITVEFQERGSKTWVKFSQFGQAPAAQVVLMAQGIESYFDSLASFLVKK
jgi:uncharacterized protein YndB with AHSA1/START domain